MNNPMIPQMIQTLPLVAEPSKANPPREKEAEKEKETQAQKLVKLASAAELFHTTDQEAYAIIPVGEHKEVWAVGSRHFKLWLRQIYFAATDKNPSDQSLKDACGQLESMALFGRDSKKPVTHEVFVRVAGDGERIYLDLCNPNWEVVEITAAGYRVLKESPVKFVRTKDMQALPSPSSTGDINKLKDFVNCSDVDWHLIVAWLLAAFSPSGPYPILEVGGEQGSAKSTLCKILKAITDPNRAPLNSLPKEEKDLAILAKAERVLAFDNMSGLPQGISDIFCRVSTGGAFKARKLFTDDDQCVFELQRPVVWNGIEDIATKGDLLERTLKIFLPSIGEQGRRDERTFWQEFDRALPSILAGICSVLSSILKRLPHTELVEKPRLADFALWIAAAEESLGWEVGSFSSMYRDHRNEENRSAAEGDDLCQAVIQLVEQHQGYLAMPTAELLPALNRLVSESVQKSRLWPTKKSLRGKLLRLAPALRAENISYEYRRTKSYRKHSFFKRKDSVILSPESENTSQASGYAVTESENYSVTIPSPVTLGNSTPLDRLEAMFDGYAESSENTYSEDAEVSGDRFLPGDRIDDAI